MWLTNIFLKSVTCLIILLALSFKEQKFLIVKKYNLSIFSFMDHAFDIMIQGHKDFSYVFL